MKKIFLLICLCFMVINLAAEKVTVLKELINPESIVIDGSDIYITQKAEISVYDAKTFKLKTTFGKAGQGPQEIPPFPFPMGGLPLMKICPLADKLFIAATGKILYFSKEGTFISEAKYPLQRVRDYNNLFPLGSDFFCQLTSQEKQEIFLSAGIVDKTFQQKKELKRKKMEIRGGKINIISGAMILDVYKGRIYVAGDDLSVDVFAEDGSFRKKIKHPHDPVKFTSEMKEKFDETLKYLFKAMYEQIKPIIYYPDYLPVIYNLQFSGPHLYVFTWKSRGDNRELFVFKLDGTFVEKTAVPLKMVQFILPYPFDISGKALYQLVDNEDTEEWELHRTIIH